MASDHPLPPDTVAYYDAGREHTRLDQPAGQLERARTRELIARFAPTAPATVLDVGGGTGPYAFWLAERGYTVHLVDAMPSLIEQAHQSAERHTAPLASMRVGDARRLDMPDASADVVLLLGPLYHLTERTDRLAAWREAHRVLRPGGIVLAAGISRYASLLDGLFHGFLDDERFAPILRRDLADGQHRNPTRQHGYFTTAYFHLPEELRAEAESAGFTHADLLAIEGPAWLSPLALERCANDSLAERYLEALRLIEHDMRLMNMSAHFLEVARKPAPNVGT